MTGVQRLVGGRYRLGVLLGTGGSASVFAAVDERTGADVALKILHPHLSDRLVARDAFLAEAERARGLRHPNIVAVHGVGIDEDADAPVAWIAMDRAAGVSLTELVAVRGPLHPTDATAVVDAVLRALEAAHTVGLIHRDVSPANIMVAPDSRGRIAPDAVRLLDFGLADAAGTAALGSDDLLSVEATGRAGVLGNVNYMSPEQVRGDPVDARGDIYQTGAVLHFALTGRPPFVRDSVDLTVRAHLSAPPPVPSVTDRRIPRELDRVVVRALLKNPPDRFATAGQMREALNGPAPVSRAIVPVPDAVSPRTEVTRVLGRTSVPPARRPVAPRPAPLPTALVAADGAAVVGSDGRGSRAGVWFGVTIAALIAALIVTVAVSGTPTASGGAAEPPEATPAVTPPPVTPPAAPATALEPAPPTEADVPDLSRLALGEATAALRAAGLGVGEVRRADSALPAETVLDSSPAAGARVRAGSPVALVVASGSHAIPDVAGQGRDAAAALVQAAGFAPSFAYRDAPAGTPPGTILGTDPAAATVYPVGTAITILEAVPRTPAPTATATPTPPAPTAAPTPGPSR